MKLLGTTPASTSWTEVSGVVRQREQQHDIEYLDFTIDGTPLRTLVTQLPETPRPVEEMTRLWDDCPDEAVEQLRRLLGEEPGDYEDGRVALLVCNVCGDLGCRALSASLVATEEWVEWRDLGWQVDYEPFDGAQAGFTPALTFRFDLSDYTSTLRELMTYFEERLAVKRAAGANADTRRRPRLWSRH
jgi:hypothetical protein